VPGSYCTGNRCFQRDIGSHQSPCEQWGIACQLGGIETRSTTDIRMKEMPNSATNATSRPASPGLSGDIVDGGMGDGLM
jgi:hypothetical protein